MTNKNCDSCNSCDSCDYCNFCKNLEMTEYNYFCWSKESNCQDGFQQKRYRVFNVKVSKSEYDNIKKIYHKLELDKNENKDTRFKTAFKKMWDKLTEEQRQEYFDIPHFNWEGFTFITGVKKEDEEVTEMTLSEV